MTKSKGKRPTDIKSFSHELDPRGLRSHEYFRPHNLGGFNDLEVCVSSSLFSYTPLEVFTSRPGCNLSQPRVLALVKGGLELMNVPT